MVALRQLWCAPASGISEVMWSSGLIPVLLIIGAIVVFCIVVGEIVYRALIR